MKNGARMLRLDAIAYLWKELGTSCAHLPRTHAVVQLMRAILDKVAPKVLLLTETNVPHQDNISYFGDGANEAQLVYNFPLPPLILHTLTAGDATKLTAWAKTIEPVSGRTTFLNFTASHDGIGVRPAADILLRDEFQKLVDLATAHGGQVSYKTDADGRAAPYELNINWFDAINNPNNSDVDRKTEIQRFLLSQSIALTFLGMPAIYIHSLLGSRNWYEGVSQTGRARSINREKLDLSIIEKTLADSTSLRYQVYQRYRELLRLRRAQPAFTPGATQQIIDLGPALFANRRTTGNQTLLAIHNVTAAPQTITLNEENLTSVTAEFFTDLISGNRYDYPLTLAPFQFLWLVP